MMLAVLWNIAAMTQKAKWKIEKLEVHGGCHVAR